LIRVIRDIRGRFLTILYLFGELRPAVTGEGGENANTQNTLVTQQRTSLDRGRGGHEIQALLEQIKNQLNPGSRKLG
jgi:hypothetical protein